MFENAKVVDRIFGLFHEERFNLIRATKAKYFDDAVGSFDIRLSKDEIEYLEALYVPHKIVGAL